MQATDWMRNRGGRRIPAEEISVAREAWLQALKKFMDSLPELSKSRRDKYRHTILRFAKEIKKHPDEVTRKDLEDFFQSRVDRGYKPWTVSNYKIMLKKFFRKRMGKKFVEWIKISKNIKPTIGPEDILTPEEVQRMIEACETVRDKAIISTLFEGDFRPGEFLALMIKSVIFDQYGARIHIHKGKTGARFVRVINASPHLANWIENHPLKKHTESPLWIAFDNNRKGDALQPVGLRKIVKRVSVRAHLQKHVWPYLFRHSRNTELATMVSASVMDEIAGWVQGSPMPAFYVHLSGKNTDEALLKAHGILKDEKQKKLPVQCPRCSHVNSSEQELCIKCGLALSLKAAMLHDEEQKKKDAQLDDLKMAFRLDREYRLEKNKERKKEIMERLNEIDKRLA